MVGVGRLGFWEVGGRRRWWKPRRLRSHGRGGARGSCGERRVRGPGLHHLHPPLLQPKVGHDLRKGRVREEREVGGRVAELLIRTSSERAEEEDVGDSLPEVAKFVSKFLKAHIIVVDRRVMLMVAKKFLLKEHTALEGVVEEEPVQLRPHRLRVISVAHNGVEDVLGDGLVQPAGDGGVDG